MTKHLAALVASALLIACSVERNLDQEAMGEISAACGLVRSEMIETGDRPKIRIAASDDTPQKSGCVMDQIRERNLAAIIYYGAGRITAEQQLCVDAWRREQAGGSYTIGEMRAALLARCGID